MRRLATAVSFVLFIFAFCSSAFASGTQDTPESRVKAFYTWFIQNDTDAGYPLNKPVIGEYVAKDTVSLLSRVYALSGAPKGVDYFLKVQDYDGKDWLAHIDARPAIMLGNVAIVPVTFGSTNKTNVLVFMRKIGGVWMITKVDDTRDYFP